MPHMYYSYCPRADCKACLVNHPTSASVKASICVHETYSHRDKKGEWIINCVHVNDALDPITTIYSDRGVASDAYCEATPSGEPVDNVVADVQRDDSEREHGLGSGVSQVAGAEPRERTPLATEGERRRRRKSARGRSRSPLSPQASAHHRQVVRGSAASQRADPPASDHEPATVAEPDVLIPDALPQTYYEQVIQVVQWLGRATTILNATVDLLETTVPRLRSQADQSRAAAERLQLYAYTLTSDADVVE
jgi:hypothetical protein